MRRECLSPLRTSVASPTWAKAWMSFSYSLMAFCFSAVYQLAVRSSEEAVSHTQICKAVDYHIVNIVVVLQGRRWRGHVGDPGAVSTSVIEGSFMKLPQA